MEGMTENLSTGGLPQNFKRFLENLEKQVTLITDYL